MEKENHREVKKCKDYTPFSEQVVLVGKRKESSLIVPEEYREKNGDEYYYEYLKVAGYGDMTKYVLVDQKIKLSSNSAFGPTPIWSETSDDGFTYDYFTISESFIKGGWDIVEDKKEVDKDE